MKRINQRYQLKLNNVAKLEELLQRLYDESDKIVVEVQEQINRLVNSTNLNEEIIEGKTKFAKAINDFVSSKDKAIGRKLEIAKLMGEVLKNGGNAKQAIQNTAIPMDWDDLKELEEGDGNTPQQLPEAEHDEVVRYTMKCPIPSEDPSPLA